MFELLRDRQHVVIRPATVDIYVVTVAAPAIRMLAETASSGTACAVPTEHATHGLRLLGLRPTHEPPWPNLPDFMELYLALPEDEIHIVHGLSPLVTALTEIVIALT